MKVFCMYSLLWTLQTYTYKGVRIQLQLLYFADAYVRIQNAIVRTKLKYEMMDVNIEARVRFVRANAQQ